MTYKAGDRFKVIKLYERDYSTEAIMGDELELIMDTSASHGHFKNLTENRGTEIVYWCFDKLGKLPDEPKTKVVSYEEFRDYLEEHGQTVAMTTKAWRDIPRGTKIKFVHHFSKSMGKELISSYVADGVKDQFSYPFDIRWEERWLTEYPGQFEVELKEEAPSKAEMSNYVNSMAIPEQSTYKTTTTTTGITYTDWSIGTTHLPTPDEFQQQSKLTINKPKNKLMTNIIEFAKNLTLTEDERALRKTGLQDENGNWTDNALGIVSDLEAQAKGFTDFKAILTKLNASGTGVVRSYNALQLLDLLDKYETKLIEIAKAKLAEEKACKK